VLSPCFLHGTGSIAESRDRPIRTTTEKRAEVSGQVPSKHRNGAERPRRVAPYAEDSGRTMHRTIMGDQRLGRPLAEMEAA
jgi:hypothetical protein